MTDVAAIVRHYETFSEGPRLEKSRVRRLERDTTLHVLGRHLPPGASVLELGAGHGVYALHFAARGHEVLATDLVAANVAAMAAKVRQLGLATMRVQQADATRLEGLADAGFDAVLCLGPYYHLSTAELRRRCLLECRRVARDAGIVAVSYINRAFAVPYVLGTGKALTREQYAALERVDHARDDYPDDFLGVAHFSTPDSLEAEIRECGFDIVEHAGTDGVYGFAPEALERVDEAAYLGFREHHLATCHLPAQRAASPHGLVVLKRSRGHGGAGR